MKVEFITEDDFYVLPLFEEFVRRFGAEFEITRVSCSPILGTRSRGKLARDLVSLYGVTGFLRLLSRYAVAAGMSRLPRRKDAAAYYSIGQLCAAYNVPYARIGNPNAEEFRQALEERGADILVSVACPYILKRPLLDTPRLGCINLHNAPLPKYKGMMPTFWQLFHGETNVGLTVHTMTEKIDEGALLYQDQVAVNDGETLDQLIRRSKRRAAHCVATVLRELDGGTAKPRPFSQEGGSYFTFPSREQIREFHRRGLRAI